MPAQCRVCRCSRAMPPQVGGNGRFSQPTTCCNSGVTIVNALDSYSSRQVLTQTVMNLIQEFDKTNQEATIPWLDHIKGVTKKTGFDPLEIGMSKLKGMALHNINAASKEVPSHISGFASCS